jgi:hypothetical protein
MIIESESYDDERERGRNGERGQIGINRFQMGYRQENIS